MCGDVQHPTSTFPEADLWGGGGPIRLTSDAERARRLRELRAAMSRRGLSALVIAGRGDLRYRGRVLYVSDVFQFTADNFAVILEKGGPIFIATPVVGLGQARLTTWASEFRVNAAPGREIGQILQDHGLGKSSIGIVGLIDCLSAQHLREIEETAPGAQLQDATELFETVRQVKSDEELSNLRNTSAVFRKIFAAVEAEIRPGVQEADIAGNAARLAKMHGCRDVKVAMATTPFKAVSYGSTKRIERNSLFMLWIETPGPTGYWLELRRCYSFGAPPEREKQHWELQREFWKAALAAMKPGTPASSVMAEVNKILGRAGFSSSESNFGIHGIGADAIEGMWYPGNDRVLKEGEVVSFHPSIVIPDPDLSASIGFLGMTDNVLITANGGERLTYSDDRIIEL